VNRSQGVPVDSLPAWAQPPRNSAAATTAALMTLTDGNVLADDHRRWWASTKKIAGFTVSQRPRIAVSAS
jgi:hypothetical protein